MVADIHNVYVQKLLKRIDSEHEPVYVAVTIEKHALINECFPNVEQKVLIDGGDIIYGWQIWKGELICEAEFHAVWRTISGDLIDITPKGFPIERILFVQDDRVQYKGAQVDNIRINCTSNVLVNDFIDVRKALFRIMNKGERAFSHKVELNRMEAGVYRELEEINLQLQQYVHQGGHVNSQCYCGSGASYSECLRNKLDSLIMLSKTI
jgi:hypothetical protein